MESCTWIKNTGSPSSAGHPFSSLNPDAAVFIPRDTNTVPSSTQSEESPHPDVPAPFSIQQSSGAIQSNFPGSGLPVFNVDSSLPSDLPLNVQVVDKSHSDEFPGNCPPIFGSYSEKNVNYETDREQLCSERETVQPDFKNSNSSWRVSSDRPFRGHSRMSDNRGSRGSFRGTHRYQRNSFRQLNDGEDVDGEISNQNCESHPKYHSNQSIQEQPKFTNVPNEVEPSELPLSRDCSSWDKERHHQSFKKQTFDQNFRDQNDFGGPGRRREGRGFPRVSSRPSNENFGYRDNGSHRAQRFSDNNYTDRRFHKQEESNRDKWGAREETGSHSEKFNEETNRRNNPSQENDGSRYRGRRTEMSYGNRQQRFLSDNRHNQRIHDSGENFHKQNRSSEEKQSQRPERRTYHQRPHDYGERHSLSSAQDKSTRRDYSHDSPKSDTSHGEDNVRISYDESINNISDISKIADKESNDINQQIADVSEQVTESISWADDVSQERQETTKPKKPCEDYPTLEKERRITNAGKNIDAKDKSSRQGHRDSDRSTASFRKHKPKIDEDATGDVAEGVSLMEKLRAEEVLRRSKKSVGSPRSTESCEEQAAFFKQEDDGGNKVEGSGVTDRVRGRDYPTLEKERRITNAGKNFDVKDKSSRQGHRDSDWSTASFRKHKPKIDKDATGDVAEGESLVERLKAEEVLRRSKKFVGTPRSTESSGEQAAFFKQEDDTGNKVEGSGVSERFRGRGRPRKSFDAESPNVLKISNENNENERQPLETIKLQDPRMEREKVNKSDKSRRSDENSKTSRIASYSEPQPDKEQWEKEFNIWEKHWGAIKEFKVVREIQGDLFEQPKDHSLAHCVAEDLRMGSGIAVSFKREFKNLPDLLDQRAKQGGLATLHDEENNRFVYYLVTKKESAGKPIYFTLWKSLCRMRAHIQENGVKKLAIPRLACGLDKLEWDRVKAMLESLFKDIDIEIVVCNFQQNEIYEEKKSKCKLVFEEFPITKIEAGTLLLYLATSQGDPDDVMRHMATKFDFLPAFAEQNPKTLGDVVFFEDKIQNFGLCGCIVRNTSDDQLSFGSLHKCIQNINKMNREFGKDAFDYVAIQRVDETAYFDESVNQKIITMLINFLRNVDVYVCQGSLKGEGD